MSISFDRVAERYDETRGGEDRGRHCAQTLTPLFAHTGLTLEIGAGTGLVGSALQAGGRCVVGVDMSEQMLRRAAERRLSVVRADAQALPFASDSVDDAYSVWVLHVVADPGAVIREAFRVVRPGGRYLLELTSRYQREDDEIARIRAELDLRLRRGQKSPDDPEILAPLATQAGFRVVRMIDRTSDVFFETPLEAADGIARRDMARLWDLDAQRWRSDVEPAIVALRALPEPERPRERRAMHEVLVLEKPSSI